MKTIILALLIIPLAYSQQLQPVSSQQADCGKFTQPPITTAGTFNGQNIDNRFAGCDGFVVTYSSNGFSAVSVLLQDAPLGTGGIAGAFVSFAGTIVSPFTNPTTATTQGETRATGYFPYVRIQITTTGTGYLVAEVHGFKTNPNSGSGAPASAGGCPGTVGTPCVVVGPTATGAPPTTSPLLAAGADSANIHIIRTDSLGGVAPATIDVAVADGRGSTIRSQSNGFNEFTYITYPFAFNGATGFWDQQFYCTSQARVTLANGTRTELVPVSGATVIRVCQIHMTTTAPEDFTISYGTGSACGTGTTTIDKYLSITAFSTDFQPTAALRTIASNALCVTQSATQSAEVTVVYAQF